MKDFFKPEDFNRMLDLTESEKWHIADCANAKLRAHVESLPQVFGYETFGGGWIYGEREATVSTHTARLWDIQPIEKKCEIHEPEAYNYTCLTNDKLFCHYRCKKCGKKLRATWQEDE